jgi:hypothetical protein
MRPLLPPFARPLLPPFARPLLPPFAQGDRLSCAVRNYIRTICANLRVHARSERVSKALRRFALEYTYVVDEDATTATTGAARGVDVTFDQTRALKAGPRCP